jgi:hypothetical protein
MAARKYKITPDTDELFESAAETVIKAGKASTSYIQRSLKLGYSRAARLLDLLEEHNIGGKQEGAKPRKVLKKKMPIFVRVDNSPTDRNSSRIGRKKNLIEAAATLMPSDEKPEEAVHEWDGTEEREEDEWDEEIDVIPEGLTRDEERFCRVYVSATEFYGNGTQSYIEAYDVMVVKGTREKIEKGKRKKMTYEAIRVAASKLLTNNNILTRINELLEDGGFNDEFIDKQLKFLITQSAEPRVKLGAIQEFNKLKQRIHEKSTLVHQFANEDMTDAELMERIKKNRAFFKKE